MRCLPLQLLFALLVFVANALACDSQKMLDCLNKKGGVTCFYQFSCEQDKYRLDYCRTFELGICQEYEGGKACLSNLDECHFLLEQDKKQKIKNQELAEINRNNNPSLQKLETPNLKNENSKPEDKPSTKQEYSKKDDSETNSPKLKKQYCSQAAVQDCLKHQGGQACFKKHGCESSPFKKNLCLSFSLDQCLYFGGGKACYNTQAACKSMLPTFSKTNNAELSRASETIPITKTPSITSPSKSKDQMTKTDEGDQSNSANESNKKSNRSESDNISKNEKPESTQDLKCDSKKVAQCERLGGGDRCYTQFNCTPMAYQIDYCQNFDPNKCLSYSGGVTCQQIFKNCQLFLSKVVPNQKSNSNLESNTNCQESKALTCLKKDGGPECFIENHCDKTKFQKEFCDGFNFSRCVSDNGGQACQKNQDACESFNIDHNNTSDNINRHNNFEGHLSILTDTRNPNHPQNIGKPIKTCDETLRTSDQNKKPELISSLLKEFEKFGKGVKTYSLGTYTREVTDCSGFIMLAMRKLGFAVNGPQFDLNPNFPQHFRSCDPANLKPGDVLLLNYPGHTADHWIMVSGEGAWPSGNLEMMDVSSDYVDGKPFYSGKLNRRSNLRAREVYSCVRHRDF